MKVKMLVSQAGPSVNRHPGQVVEVSDVEGAHLLATNQAQGLAGVIPASPKVEAAMMAPTQPRERVTKKKASKKKGR